MDALGSAFAMGLWEVYARQMYAETCMMSEPPQYTAAPVEEPKSGPPASHFFAAKKEPNVKVKYQLAYVHRG